MHVKHERKQCIEKIEDWEIQLNALKKMTKHREQYKKMDIWNNGERQQENVKKKKKWINTLVMYLSVLKCIISKHGPRNK